MKFRYSKVNNINKTKTQQKKKSVGPSQFISLKLHKAPPTHPFVRSIHTKYNVKVNKYVLNEKIFNVGLVRGIFLYLFVFPLH